MMLADAVSILDKHTVNPQAGLPEDVFYYVSRITPLINVDLLIKNDLHQTLLTWRDDGFCPPGWHVPGGIVRYKETINDRILAVGRNELGATVIYEKNPITINEVIHPSRRDRGHFISLLFKCTLASGLNEKMKYVAGTPQENQWMWHQKCPSNIIEVHTMYKKYITV